MGLRTAANCLDALLSEPLRGGAAVGEPVVGVVFAAQSRKKSRMRRSVRQEALPEGERRSTLWKLSLDMSDPPATLLK